MQRAQPENPSDYNDSEPDGKVSISDQGNGKLLRVVEPKSMASLNVEGLFEGILSDEEHDNLSSATKAIKCEGKKPEISTGFTQCSKLTADSKDSIEEIVDKPNKPKNTSETPALQILRTSNESVNKMERFSETVQDAEPIQTTDQDSLDKKIQVSSDAISLTLNEPGSDDVESCSSTSSIPIPTPTSDFSFEVDEIGSDVERCSSPSSILTSDFSSGTITSSDEDSADDFANDGSNSDQSEFISNTQGKVSNDKPCYNENKLYLSSDGSEMESAMQIVHKVLDGPCLQVPAKKNIKPFTLWSLHKGIVVSMNITDDCGMIRYVSKDKSKSEVSFDFEDVQNLTDSTLCIRISSKIRFQSDPHNKSRACVVVADLQSHEIIYVPPNENQDDEIDIPRVSQILELAHVPSSDIRRHNGTMVQFSHEHRFGFIRADKFRGDVFVHFSELFIEDFPLIPRKNQRVTFVLRMDLKNPYTFHAESVILDAKIEAPSEPKTELSWRARRVSSDHGEKDNASPAESKLLNDEIDSPTLPNKEMCWYDGDIISVNHQRKFAFIKSFEFKENIHLHLWKLPEFGLPLKRGDEVTFQIDIKSSKMSAHCAKVLRYVGPRSSDEMNELFDSSMEILQSARAPILIKELSSLDAFWQYFDHLNDFHQSRIPWNAMKFITLFLKSNPSHDDVNRILDILGQESHYLEQVANFSPEIVSSNFLRVSNFCEQVINKCPEFVVRLFPLIKMLPRKCFEQILLKFITKDGSTTKEQDNWESLVEGISDEEMLRDDLIKRDNNLSEVKVDAPYDSYFQYIDTYFRLLKVETFYGIQEAISSLKKGTLGNQNINIFDGIRFTGVKLEEASVLLSIPTSTVEKKIQWANDDTLKHGTLICLLIDNQWKKFIWMTVERKDDEIVVGEGHILAQMCPFNTMRQAEILSVLYRNNGNITMVESPSFFGSTFPALQTLRRLQMEDSPLCDSIVQAVPLLGCPTYQLEQIYEDDLSNDSDSEHGDYHDVLQYLFQEKMPRIIRCARAPEGWDNFIRHQMRTMDDSQKRAFKHALDNRLAIIQGPPGTGKTFIGIKLVETLLEFDLRSPILILTYKNHALDEFLKACLNFCDTKDLVRIGSRSNETVLEKCNLQSHLKNFKSRSGKFELLSKMWSLQNQLNQSLNYLSSSASKDAESLLRALNEEQLCDLIRGAQWGEGPDCIEFSDETNQCVDNAWVNRVLDENIARFGSIRKFLLSSVDEVSIEEINPEEKLVQQQQAKELLHVALEHWLPSSEMLEQLRDLYLDFDLSSLLESEVFEDKKIESFPCWGFKSKDNMKKVEEYLSIPNFLVDVLRDVLLFRRKPWNVPSGFLLHCSEREAWLCGNAMFDKCLNDIYHRDSERDAQLCGNTTFNKFLKDIDHKCANKDEIERRMRWNLKMVLSEFESLCKLPFNCPNKFSFAKEDFPSCMKDRPDILQKSRMWELTEGERHQLIYALTQSQIDETLQETIDEIESCRKELEKIRNLEKLDILASKQIVGMTITGANMNSELLQQLRSKVVIIEEAAEVLEPQLFACLNEHVEHLIMIGDHQQLRPNVEAYPLVTDYQFDVSMMERLIRSKFPYQTLTNQSRMRPEFAELLTDIYPDYQTNLNHVMGNNPPEFMAKSMFFWTHRHMEDGNKKGSKINSAEANLVIALAEFLTKCGVAPQKITILAPYMSQVELIRSKRLTKISVQTIDMFQGDENDVIIVSLVRSNQEGNIGFLNSLNRRCVLQSRAKCGFYLVGNEETLIQGKGATIWRPFVQAMKDRGCLGPKLPIQCRKHPSYLDASQLEDLDLVRNPSKLCSQVCGDLFPCQSHTCNQTCFPKHKHDKCLDKVRDTFPSCQHDVMRFCWMEIERLKCLEPVLKVLKCGHSMIAPCSKETRKIRCQEPCTKLMDCEEKHPCKSQCGIDHDHLAKSCTTKVDFSFPECKHKSPIQKPCNGKMKCKFEIKFTGSCNHLLLRECWQTELDVKCKSPCVGKLRSCGHPCYNECGMNCDEGSCPQCEEEIDQFRKRAKKRAKKLKMKARTSDYKLTDLDKSDPEYIKVQDQVTKYVQAMHSWNPVITRIQLVQNLNLEIQYEKVKSQGFGTFEDLKFHGTSEERILQISKEGFRMPGRPKQGKKPGMFGQGIYFATDSSKSAQNIYTKNSNKLLLCRVFLGKSHNLYKANPSMTRVRLAKLKCDSVFAPRGSEVRNDEFVIYNRFQAYAKYIIHFFTTEQSVIKPDLVHPIRSGLIRKVLQPSRHFQSSNPDDMLFRIAESAFYRSGQNTHKKIESIEYVSNPVLEMAFQNQKIDFKKAGIPDHEILAFHGTKPSNVDSILKTNLSLQHSSRFAHGEGLYFSEYPKVSLGYGEALILFKVLPGNEYAGPNMKWPQFQSKCVSKCGDGYGKMVIVKNSSQFHPFLIYHFVQDVIV